LYNSFITVGASGAVFGILLAFGWFFPHQKIYLYFLIPVPARIFVILYGVFELFFGVASFKGDSIAHFAHLGGMFFGLILILLWRKKYKNFDEF
jgi:membrane associated rhomboid family serine protease